VKCSRRGVGRSRRSIDNRLEDSVAIRRRLRRRKGTRFYSLRAAFLAIATVTSASVTLLITGVWERAVAYKVSGLVAKVISASFLIGFRSDVTSIYRGRYSFEYGFSGSSI